MDVDLLLKVLIVLLHILDALGLLAKKQGLLLGLLETLNHAPVLPLLDAEDHETGKEVPNQATYEIDNGAIKKVKGDVSYYWTTCEGFILFL